MFKRNGIYYFYYYSNNKRLKKTTGKTNKKEAYEFIQTFNQEFQENEKLKLQPKSLKDFIIEYDLYTKQLYSKSYLKTVKTSFNELIKIIPDNTLFNDLTFAQLEKFFTLTFQRTQYGALLYLRTLKAAFNKAKDWNYIKTNPLDKIKLQKTNKAFPVFITSAELTLIIDKETNQDYKDIYLLAFHTGLRLSEIINLKWNSINLNEMMLKVSNTETFTTKSKRERLIPINKTVFEMIINRMPKIFDLNKPAYLFKNIYGALHHADTISKNFKRSVKSANLNNKIHFHSLRHSFASNLVSKGISLAIIKELLGHSSYNTSLIYSHLQFDTLKDAVKLLDIEQKKDKAINE